MQPEADARDLEAGRCRGVDIPCADHSRHAGMSNRGRFAFPSRGCAPHTTRCTRAASAGVVQSCARNVRCTNRPRAPPPTHHHHLAVTDPRVRVPRRRWQRRRRARRRRRQSPGRRRRRSAPAEHRLQRRSPRRVRLLRRLLPDLGRAAGAAAVPRLRAVGRRQRRAACGEHGRRGLARVPRRVVRRGARPLRRRVDLVQGARPPRAAGRGRLPRRVRTVRRRRLDDGDRVHGDARRSRRGTSRTTPTTPATGSAGASMPARRPLLPDGRGGVRAHGCKVAAGDFASNGTMWNAFEWNCANDNVAPRGLCTSKSAELADGAAASYLDRYKNEIVASATRYGLGNGFRPEQLAYPRLARHQRVPGQRRALRDLRRLRGAPHPAVARRQLEPRRAVGHRGRHGPERRARRRRRRRAARRS